MIDVLNILFTGFTQNPARVTGLEKLCLRLLTKFGGIPGWHIEFPYTWDTDYKGLAHRIVRMIRPSAHIIISGYSLGGHTAIKLNDSFPRTVSAPEEWCRKWDGAPIYTHLFLCDPVAQGWFAKTMRIHEEKHLLTCRCYGQRNNLPDADEVRTKEILPMWQMNATGKHSQMDEWEAYHKAVIEKNSALLSLLGLAGSGCPEPEPNNHPGTRITA